MENLVLAHLSLSSWKCSTGYKHTQAWKVSLRSPCHLTAALHSVSVGRMLFGRQPVLCTSESVYEEMTVCYNICTATD